MNRLEPHRDSQQPSSGSSPSSTPVLAYVLTAKDFWDQGLPGPEHDRHVEEIQIRSRAGKPF